MQTQRQKPYSMLSVRTKRMVTKFKKRRIPQTLRRQCHQAKQVMMMLRMQEKRKIMRIFGTRSVRTPRSLHRRKQRFQNRKQCLKSMVQRALTLKSLQTLRQRFRLVLILP